MLGCRAVAVPSTEQIVKGFFVSFFYLYYFVNLYQGWISLLLTLDVVNSCDNGEPMDEEITFV